MPLMRSRLLFQPSELHSVVESRHDKLMIRESYSGTSRCDLQIVNYRLE